MSYRSRVYRQRTPRAKDDSSKEPFFSQHDTGKPSKKGSFFQAKLAVNEPGDQHEQEADSVANAVVNKSGNQPVVQQQQISPVQRLATTSEEERVSSNDERMERDKEKPFQRQAAEPEKEKAVQKKGSAEPDKEKPLQKKAAPEQDKEKPVQAKSDTEKEHEKAQKKEDVPKKEEEKKTVAAVQRKAESAGAAPASVHSKMGATAGKGKPLPRTSLHEMGHAFGTDFSSVRVHDDNDAASMSEALNAKAFTHGKDVYFGKGQFNPQSATGKHLLAHELTHVVQQNGPVIQRDTAPLPKFDYSLKQGEFENFSASYFPDAIKPGEGNIVYRHNIGLVFDSTIDAKQQEKFRKDFKTNVESLWQDKFLFELNDPSFTHYTAHVKLDINFTDDPTKLHTVVEVKSRPNDFRSNVEGRTNSEAPKMRHVGYLDLRDPSPEELAKKNKGKGGQRPSMVQQVGNFGFDSDAINSDCETGIRKIEEHIGTLADGKDSDEMAFLPKITYIGRASPEGNKYYNIELSRRRARAVKKRVETDTPKAKSMTATIEAEGADKTNFEANKENYRRVNVLVYPFTPFSQIKENDQNTAAHEFGHMIGYGDEYDEKGDAKYEKKIAGDRPRHYEDVKAIMGQAAADELDQSHSSSMMSIGNDLKKGHYAYFLKAIRDLTGNQQWNIK